MLPFGYWDRGTFAVIGRGKAVGVAFRSWRLRGLGAWLAWLFVHILFLIGFRSRLVVLVNWAYAYLGYRRAARIITGGGAAVEEKAAPATEESVTHPR
jgi:NADH:ubiquinone reductase (H+-translocating)